MTILAEILRQKENEITKLAQQSFPRMNKVKVVPKVARNFRDNTQMNIIAEIKRASPSKGAIDMHVDPVAQAKEYEKLGAGAISVLTDETFFNGSMDDLRAVREAVDLPLLCKDFIIESVQIDQAQASGASIILLIVAALTESEFKRLYTYATEKGLEVLSEVHNEKEMEIALDLQAAIIGINNRNLKTFEVDLRVTERLASLVDNPETILISESGIKTREDVIKVANSGASGILVGETFMRATNLAHAFSNFKVPVRKEKIQNAR